MSPARGEPESLYACLRLAASLALMTIGGVGMYAMAVALPLIQAEFDAARSTATLPYTATMIGFGVGGILMGKLADRHGVMVPALIGSACLGAGFIVAGMAPSLWLFGLRGLEFWIAIAVGIVIAYRFLIDWNRQYRELWLDREKSKP